MRLSKLFIMLIIGFSIASCSTDDTDWNPPANDPTGNYLYQSSTMYYEKDGELDKNSPVEADGYIKLTEYLNSADISATPQLGWSYQIHISNFTKHTLINGDSIISFSINPQQVELNYYYYSVIGTNNKAIRNSDGSLIGYYDGYVKGDSLVYEYRSNDGYEGWSIANIKAKVRN